MTHSQELLPEEELALEEAAVLGPVDRQLAQEGAAVSLSPSVPAVSLESVDF